MLDTLKEWDRTLFVFLNNLGIEPLDSFWIFVTQIESWTALFILFAVIIFNYYKGKKGILVFLFAVAAFAITLLCTELTKEFVARLRPNNELGLANLIRTLQKPTSYSFFSGHASTSMAITTFMVLAIRSFNKWIFLAFLWPLLFMTSRIYVGVHYPSDILVGALVGVIIGGVFHKVSQRALQPLK
ncbi:MAG: phosphatase PAP2 family protein [Bacteroidota bacterium]